MVAYSFKGRFANAIVDGRKRQTIRAIGRKRHARVGERIQLYTGMRTSGCRKLINPDPLVVAVEAISLYVPTRLEPVALGPLCFERYVTAEFAKADGFDSVEDFTKFWFDTHGPGKFEGLLIRWSASNA